MRHLILSDLHLGDPRARRDDAIIDILLGESYDVLVLAGDIYDSWADGNVERVRSRHLNLVEELNDIAERKPVYWLKGNHETGGQDWRIGPRQLVPGAELVEHLKLGDTLVIHGHQIERGLLADYSRLLTKVNLLVYRVCRLDLQRLFRAVGSWYPRKCKREQNDYVAKDCAGRYQRLVLGHTHLPEWYEYKWVDVVNTGDWIMHRSYVILDEAVVQLKGV